MSLEIDRPASVHLFDLDQTLIEKNSSFAFCRHLCNQRILKKAALAQAFFSRWQSKALNLSLREIHSLLFQRVLKGLRQEDLENEVDGFLNQFLWSSIYPPTFSVLKRHQHLGAKVMLLSSSPAFLVRKVAKRLNFDHWIGTEYNLDENGRFASIKRFMDGEEKAKQLKSLCKERGILLAKTTAYSDSYHDLPFLLSAGKAVAVNPDRRLLAYAKQHQWETL